MKRSWLPALLVIILIFVPRIASADAGTPLMWASALHLVLGNALIGVGEGLLIARVFKRPKPKCILLMVAANYFSAWVGGVMLIGRVAAKLDWNLYNAWQLFWLFAAACYVVTVFLEWPFVGLCFWRQEKAFARSFKASLLAQTASYLVLFGWYWLASGKSLYTQMHIVPASEIHLPPDLRLFYISAPDGHVREGPQTLGSMVSTNLTDRLLIKPLDGRTKQWEIVLRLDAWDDRDTRILTVLAPINADLASTESREDQPNGRGTWFNFGEAVELGSYKERDWKIRTGFWPIEGMRIENRKTGDRVHFAWETLFSQWRIRTAILLPDDHAIFQLGDDQICVLEPSTRKVALLVRGRGPAVVMK